MIYFLQHPDTGLVKIGKTIDYSKRLSALMSEYGDLVLLGLMSGYTDEEAELHERFAHLNAIGELEGCEWFYPKRELMDYINTYSKLMLPLPFEEEQVFQSRGRVRHRLLELIQEKELELGRRLSVAEVARNANVNVYVIHRWLDQSDETTRFDARVLSNFCDYFGVDIGELLVYEPEPEGNDAA